MSFSVEKFSEITAKTHTDQGIWFLNGFWEEGLEAEAEKIWEIVHLFLEVQLDRKVRYGKKIDVYEEESDLEEHRSHRLLELMGETQTVMALRKRLSALDVDQNHRMAVTEFLLDRYKKTPKQIIDAPQGNVPPEKLAAAQKACDDAADAFSRASDAAAEAVVATAKVKAAEAELQASVEEIKNLEDAKTAKIAKCQAIIDDPSSGAVKKGKAVQEKEGTLSEDPLPLRKAKITQGAALKKVTKAVKAAEEETIKAAAAKVAAEVAMAEAQAALNELKKGGGSPNGKIWWMERVLAEKKKFMK